MRCLSKHIQLSFLAITLLLIVSLACSPTGALPSGKEQPTSPPAATVASQPAATSPAKPASPTAGAAAPTSAPSGGKDSPFGKVADPTELNSYRTRMMMEVRKKDGTKSGAMPMLMEWVKQPPATHMTMGEGKQATEVISIGDKTWIKMGAQWMESPSGQSQQKNQMPENFMPQQNVTVKALGDDTVNGVKCKRQSYSGQVTVVIPIPNKPETKLTFNVKGEVCIANQAGLPPVIIREKSEVEGNVLNIMGQLAAPDLVKPGDPTEITYWERELYDINTPITIKPPEGAVTMPGLPTPGVRPTGLPLTPGVRITPVPKATVAATATGPKPGPAGSAPTAIPLGVKSFKLAIKGTDAIYLADRTDVKIPLVDVEDEAFPLLRCGGDLLETWPASIAVTAGAKFSFKVTGELDFWGGTSPTGPDGWDSVSAIDALGGISDYTGPQGALVGVFLDAANPKDKTAPDALEMESLGTDFATLTPELGQVFFIGDGLTGTGDGKPQTLVAPRGATRLFLGIADAISFGGPPGCYSDNLGAFQVQVTRQ